MICTTSFYIPIKTIASMKNGHKIYNMLPEARGTERSGHKSQAPIDYFSYSLELQSGDAIYNNHYRTLTKVHIRNAGRQTRASKATSLASSSSSESQCTDSSRFVEARNSRMLTEI